MLEEMFPDIDQSEVEWLDLKMFWCYYKNCSYLERIDVEVILILW